MEQQQIAPTAGQTVVFEMAKSPEQLAAEAAALALEKFQAEAALLLKANQQLEEDSDEDREHRDYTRVIKLRGDTWLFTWESCSARAMLYSKQPEGRTLRVSSRMIPSAIEGEDGFYLESHTGINVTQLFKGKRSDISQLVMQCANQGDADVDYTLDKIMSHGEFNLAWPTGVESIDLTDLYLLLRGCKSKGELVIDPKTGELAKIQTLQWNAETMRNPEYVSYGLRNTIAMGTTLVSAQREAYCANPKIGVDALPLRPATQAEIASAVERNRTKHALLAGAGNEGYSHVQYKGMGYTPGPWNSKIPHVVNSRVVVDAEGLRLMNPGYLNSLVGLYDYEIERTSNDEPQKVTKLSEDDLACLAPIAVFFNLERSAWMIGAVDNCDHIAFRSDAFSQLVLDAQRKRLVEALVVNTNDGDGVNVDIIDGKGGGAIFLLDGPPGTGKTLTAEATAEKLQRTLYKVGLGELGTNAAKLEDKLNQVLSTARRWNAVLLLDEADVFLEKRSTENLERNAMVAVFLRLLEYYNGILFLTTNRGDNFDPAVISRITLALHFKRQEQAGRATIWTNLLRNAGVTVTAKEAQNLAEIDINGREIKNAINSSRALAKADGTAVTYTHIREIVDASRIFETEVKREEEATGETGLITKLVTALLKLVK